MKKKVAPNKTAFLEMKVDEFFSTERFIRHGVRIKFTRARILHFLSNRNTSTVGSVIELSSRVDLSLGNDFGESSYTAMVKILEAEGLQLHKLEPVRMPYGWAKAQKRERQQRQLQDY